jgi:hypothetical protein
VLLQLQQLAFTIGFTVSDEYQGGLNIPVHLVTLGGSITRDTSAIQTVTLTFAFPKDGKG